MMHRENKQQAIPRCRGRRGALGMVMSLLSSLPASAMAAQLMVVGTPHLSVLEPGPVAEQRAEAVERLARFAPTLVCVEAMPAERARQFAADPDRHGELLLTFALDAVRLAPEQQLRLSLDAPAALDAARDLERQAGELDTAARIRLVGLQLAGHEPWSALLNWSGLTGDGQDEAAQTLGPAATERLRSLAGSANEIVTLAIPLAARLGHRRLCAVDSFVDELAVAALEAELMPLLQDEGIGRGIEAFNAEQASHWRPERRDGLVALLHWMNSAAFAGADRRAEWDIFAGGAPRGATEHDAGLRRLGLWHARNADIASNLYRAVASPEGERTLLLIGAAHRPFLEQALRAQPWIDVRPATELLEP